ncbi:MAG TPA: rhodanese-like domain-containing protein [Thermomicrobiales bacterium]|nr:rhodanese-like domain-containing protein [Thermomicrobiales bacterium]
MNLKPIGRRTFIAGLVALPLAGRAAPSATAQNAGFPLIVDLDWLANEATSPDLRLFDVSPLHVWREDHIDSARHAWWRDTVDPNYPVFGAVLTQGDEESHRQQVLDSLDLRPGDRVVVYDNVHGFRAARLVWFLRFLGFPRAALLNAGVDDWRLRPFSIDSASTSSGSPVVDPQSGYYLVTQQVLDRLGTSGFQLIDIRTDDERANDLDGNMPEGQIPGSIRLPWSTLLDTAGHLLPAGRIGAIAANAGLDPSQPSVLYGSFGVDAALSWLALTDAGFSDLQTYDRGWAEWSITPSLPREPLS